MAVADGAHHFDIEKSALHDALGLDKFSLLLEFLFPPFELFLNADDGAVALVLRHDVVRFRVDGNARQVFVAGPHFASEGINLAKSVNLIAPHFDAISLIFIGRVNFDHVAANAKGAAAKVFAALVLNINEAAEEGFARSLVAFFKHDQHAVVGLGRAEAVNAGDGSDDDDIAALEERARGDHAELVELVVDGGFLVDVKIRGRDVGFGLVIIVVADEIFEGVFRKEAR